jgi:tungstate transport system substrate-binding protein
MPRRQRRRNCHRGEKNRIVLVVMRPFILAILVALGMACRTAPEPLVLATTTSVANSGLLDQTLPAFEQHAGIRVRPVPVGSGRALRMLGEGQADVIISHAPQQEADALREHADWFYRKVFYNDFLIAGPARDPGGVRQARDALDAMRRIQESSATFVSRGDESGTHERERSLARDAGITFAPERVIVTGQGMSSTLRIASEMDAYTLTDRGTFEQFTSQLRIVELYRGDTRLLNTYAVVCRPSSSAGHRFAIWLADGPGRDGLAAAIASGALKGFAVWPEGRPRNRPDDTP